MSELRIKSTGTLKLFENDNTSSVTIASPASLGADRTITLPDGDVTLVAGTMSTGGVALTGSTNNQVTTVTGADAIAGETNLIYNGTILGVGAAGSGTPTYVNGLPSYLGVAGEDILAWGGRVSQSNYIVPYISTTTTAQAKEALLDNWNIGIDHEQVKLEDSTRIDRDVWNQFDG